ncbi:MAG: hypothetical protein Unbinned5350contig1001_24 [Prokaryotic dsDNA virus sp.]|nr:MAG: hypothetical protein Unbinned5350contig1001_24 [Prokaryotic dsDNA virus sp.]|tara:strand:- start:22019 stop:22909 length:891 start_codon:yes stop_codon:yes gene_type:complete
MESKWKNLENYKEWLKIQYEIGGVALREEIIEIGGEMLEDSYNEIRDFLTTEINKPRFRASSIGGLKSDPRLKSDKEAGKLAKGVETMVEDIWLKKNYGYDAFMEVNATQKGKMCEEDAIGLVQLLDKGAKEYRFKNEIRMYNEFSNGECDIALNDSIEDIKVAYDVRSFFQKGKKEFYTHKGEKIWGFNKLQFGQAQDYMRLWNKPKFTLLYCAIDTPEELIRDEEKRVYYKYGMDEDSEAYIEASKQIRKNHDFNQIPIEKRVKKFTILRDQDYLDDLREREITGMKYYETLEL